MQLRGYCAAGGARRAIALVGVVLALAGCSTQPTQTSQSSALPSLQPFAGVSAPGATVAPSSGLPIEQYMLVGRDLYAVLAAQAILAQQCMAKQGFSIQIPAPAPLAKLQLDLTYRRYGAPVSLADAQEHGFRIPPGDRSPETPAIVSFRQSITPAEVTALQGSPSSPVPSDPRYDDGCLGVADRQLMEGATAIKRGGLEPPMFVRELNLDPRATDSPTVKADVKVFTACMAAAGYSGMDSPLDIPAQFKNATTYQGPVSAAQISAAVTEFNCRQSSGVEEAMRAAEVAFELKAIDANPEKFAQVKQELNDVVRRATTIVAGGG